MATLIDLRFLYSAADQIQRIKKTNRKRDTSNGGEQTQNKCQRSHQRNKCLGAETPATSQSGRQTSAMSKPGRRTRETPRASKNGGVGNIVVRMAGNANIVVRRRS